LPPIVARESELQSATHTDTPLVPADARTGWTRFRSPGYACDVAGHLHRDSLNPAVCGMPLGGIGTGCLDLETSGLWGYNTVFNSLAPRGGPMNRPALGLSVDGRTWVLSTMRSKQYEEPTPGAIIVDGMAGAQTDERLETHSVESASDILYFGHYPIVDLSFETTSPIRAGARCFSPFIPGDIEASLVPGLIMEIRLENGSSRRLVGTLATTFDGPSDDEAGSGDRSWRRVDQAWSGVVAGTDAAAIALGAIGEAEARTGGPLGIDWSAWADIAEALPDDHDSCGASVAIDFDLGPGESRTVRFVLAWRSPYWHGGGIPNDPESKAFEHMYARRFHSAEAAADLLAHDHQTLLRRIIAWQSVVYTDDTLPDWMQDSLINVFHLITEDGVWAAKTDALDDWVREADGLFGLNEAPRACPQMECLPCSWFASLPLVYFYPELALSTLRAYQAYQDDEGCPPWIFGGCTCNTEGFELTKPHRGYQVAQNPTNYIDMADRYWQCTGDDDFLREFYPSLRRATEFMIGMNSGPDGVISFPDHRVSACYHMTWETEGFEWCEWYGMATHLGAMRLAHLRIVARMATAIGDEPFAAACEAWFEQGSQSLEEKMWAGTYYLNFWEEASGKRMDAIFGYQLDGQWMADLHGVDPVFRPDRIGTVLDTIRNANGAQTEHGAINFCNPDGSAMADNQPFLRENYQPHDFFTPEAFILGMTYLYRGDPQYGLELGARCMRAVVVQSGRMWDQPNILNGQTGDAKFGNDYYQNLVLWSFPAAIAGQDQASPCRPGGLVDRIIQAGTADAS